MTGKARTTSGAKAGKDAAQRSTEEQREVLDDAKAPTDKQQEELNDQAGATQAAPDHTAQTDVGYAEEGVGPAKPEARVPELGDADAPQPSSTGEADVDTRVVRHSDQREGVVSASAFNVSRALKLKPNTEWNEALGKAIRGFQKELGAKETGYLTRDQCRRLGLTLL